jgi:hypothetical protein
MIHKTAYAEQVYPELVEGKHGRSPFDGLRVSG